MRTNYFQPEWADIAKIITREALAQDGPVDWEAVLRRITEQLDIRDSQLNGVINDLWAVIWTEHGECDDYLGESDFPCAEGDNSTPMGAYEPSRVSTSSGSPVDLGGPELNVIVPPSGELAVTMTSSTEQDNSSLGALGAAVQSLNICDENEGSSFDYGGGGTVRVGDNRALWDNPSGVRLLQGLTPGPNRLRMRYSRQNNVDTHNWENRWLGVLPEHAPVAYAEINNLLSNTWTTDAYSTANGVALTHNLPAGLAEVILYYGAPFAWNGNVQRCSLDVSGANVIAPSDTKSFAHQRAFASGSTSNGLSSVGQWFQYLNPAAGSTTWTSAVRSVGALGNVLQSGCRTMALWLPTGTPSRTQAWTPGIVSTNSTTAYVSLGGPTINVTVSGSGILTIALSADINADRVIDNPVGSVAFKMTGANVYNPVVTNTLAGSANYVGDVRSICSSEHGSVRQTRTGIWQFTGLTPGATTIEAVYANCDEGADGNDSSDFENRYICAWV